MKIVKSDTRNPAKPKPRLRKKKHKILVLTDIHDGSENFDVRKRFITSAISKTYKAKVVDIWHEERTVRLSPVEKKKLLSYYDIVTIDTYLNGDISYKDYEQVVVIGNPDIFLTMSGEFSDNILINYGKFIEKDGTKIFNTLGTDKLYKMSLNPKSKASKDGKLSFLRCFRKVIQTFTGTVESPTLPSIKTCLTIKDIKDLVLACKITKEVAIDVETHPDQPGIDKDAKLKKKSLRLIHNTRPGLNRLHMVQMTPQIGASFVVPVFHPESPFNVGCYDKLEVYTGKDERNLRPVLWPVYIPEGHIIRVKKNDKWISRYDGEIVNFEKHVVDALISNWRICKSELKKKKRVVTKKGKIKWKPDPKIIDNYFIDVVFPLINKKITGNHKIDKIYHNQSMDRNSMRALNNKSLGKLTGFTFKGLAFDTMEMIHVLSKIDTQKLKEIVSRFWPEFDGFEIGLDYENEPLKTYAIYAGLDTDLTLRLYHFLLDKLLAHPDHYRFFRNIKSPGGLWFSDMELEGDYIDIPKLEQLVRDIQDERDEVEYQFKNNPAFQSFIFNRAESRQADSIAIMEKYFRWVVEKEIEKAEAHIEKFPVRTSRKKLSVPRLTAQHKLAWLKKENWQPGPYANGAVLTAYAKLTLIRRGKTNDYYEVRKAKSGGIKFKDKRIFTKPGATAETFSFSPSAGDMKDLFYLSKYGLKYHKPKVVADVTIKGVKRKVTDNRPSLNKDVIYDFDDPSGLVYLYRRYSGLNYMITSAQEVLALVQTNGHLTTNFRYTETDRSASTSPNMQNFMQRTDIKENEKYVERFLECFTLPDQDFVNWYRYKCDLSMAELRWACEVFEIDSMARAINLYDSDPDKYPDLHVIAAAASMGITPEELMAQKAINYMQYSIDRTGGKALNFGLIFGQSAAGIDGNGGLRRYGKLQYRIDWSVAQATRHRNTWFKLYPEILKAHKKYKAWSMKHGVTRTMFGSYRQLPYINSRDNYIASTEQRRAINTPVQGSSSIGMLLSGIMFYIRSKILNFEGRTINLIHDDIPGVCKKTEAKLYFQELIEACTNLPLKEYFNFEFKRVKLVADYEVGSNWANCKSLNDEVKKLTWEDYKPRKLTWRNAA